MTHSLFQSFSYKFFTPIALWRAKTHLVARIAQPVFFVQPCHSVIGRRGEKSNNFNWSMTD
jgi:hypothetical protein